MTLTPGGLATTVTVFESLTEPYAPPQSSLKFVVANRAPVDSLLFSGFDPFQELLIGLALALHHDTLALVQESIDAFPEKTVVGETERETEGVGGGTT